MSPPDPAFGRWLRDQYVSTAVTLLVDVGHRCGLWETLKAGQGTSQEIASRAGLDERVTREWLGGVVVSGIVDYEPESATYSLRPERAPFLAGSAPTNAADRSLVMFALGSLDERMPEAFRSGAGIGYDAYYPRFLRIQDGMRRKVYDSLLVSDYLPLVDGLTEKLAAGAEVADVGCGSGHCLNLLAAAFPASRFTGLDISDEALLAARVEAEQMGLRNVVFERRDAVDLPEGRFDAVFVMDAIHDQVAPDRVLAAIRRSLSPDGLFVMIEVRMSSSLEEDTKHPMAPFVYAFSVLHCLQVSLVGGGMGLGTAWGERRAREMLDAAGFRSVEVFEAPADPINGVFVCRV